MGSINTNDINQQMRNMEKEIKVLRERCRILQETTSSLLFEYTPMDDRMVFYYSDPDNKERKEISNYKTYMKNTPTVHPAHAQEFMNVLLQACENPTRGEVEYISKVSSQDYEWYRALYSSVSDAAGKVVVVLGRIQNINKTVTERQNLIHRVETDFLTGLYNKGAAQEKIEKWLEANPTLEAQMIMLDMDNFKKINDSYGHSFGDDILKEVAQILEQHFGDDSIVARFGGDEFVIFVEKSLVNIAASRVDAMLGSITKNITSMEEPVSCSVGIASRITRDDGYEDLLARADSAMYTAKKSGKNRSFIYKER